MPKFEHSVSDRMQVIGRGDLLHPGTCMHCGSGSCDDGYVKLDVFYEWEGDQYLCLNCAKQLIDLVGGCWPEDFTVVMQEKLELELRLTKTSELLEKANERLAVYDAAILSARPDNVVDSGILADNAVPGKSEVSTPDEQLEFPINVGESEPKESVEGERSDDANVLATSNIGTKRTFKL